MPYLTPDDAPPDMVCRTIVIPDDPKWKAIVNGALSELFHVWNFEQSGDLTPQETADFFYQMWSDFHESVCPVQPIIGEIRMFGFDPPPTKWLRCDGASKLRADYPDLFSAIGTNFGTADGTHFNVPDFGDRSPYGKTTFTAVGTQSGEEQHTLTVSELPAHNHQERGLVTTLLNQSSGSGTRTTMSLQNSSASTTPLTTADTGSGNPHDILHPVLVVPFGIYAGV
jgi:microcystin-dependent protein